MRLIVLILIIFSTPAYAGETIGNQRMLQGIFGKPGKLRRLLNVEPTRRLGLSQLVEVH